GPAPRPYSPCQPLPCKKCPTAGSSSVSVQADPRSWQVGTAPASLDRSPVPEKPLLSSARSAPANGSPTTVPCTRSHSPTAKAERYAPLLARSTCPSTSHRSAPPTCGSPVKSPTGGSARRSSLRPLTRSSTSYVKAPPQPDAPSTTSNSLSRLT